MEEGSWDTNKNVFTGFFPGLFLLILLFCMPYKLFFSVVQYRQEELFSSPALAAFALAFLFFAIPEKGKYLYILFSQKLFSIPFLLLFLLPFFQFSALSTLGAEKFFLPYFYLFLPLFACIFAGEFRKKLPLILAWTSGILFLITFAGAFSRKYYYPIIYGLPGNRNWNAALLLATLPFLLYFLFKYLRNRWQLSRRTALLLLLLPVFMAVYVLTRTGSLGTWAGIAGCGLFFFPALLPNFDLRKKAFLILCIFCILFGGLLFLSRDKILPCIYKSGSAGERIELLSSAITVLLKDTPIQGNSFGRIEELLTTNRSKEYFLVLNPAIRSPHPHNHILYMMLGWGIIGGFLLWGIFLVLIPVIRSYLLFIGEWGKGKNEDKLLFLSMITLLTHGQIDLVLEVWPTGALFLLLLGLCWEKSFVEGKSVPCGKNLTVTGGRKIFFYIAGISFLLFGTFLAGRKAAVAVLKEKLYSSGNLPAEKFVSHIRSLAFLSPENPTLLYDLMLLSLRRNEISTALSLAEIIEKGTTPNYARIHSVKAHAFLMQGNVEGALKEFTLDAQYYPTAVLPIYNMMQIAERHNKKHLLPVLKEEFIHRRNLLHLTEEEFIAILKEPYYELVPWHYSKGSPYQNWQKRFAK